MKDYITERVNDIAHYLLETKATVRAAAKKFLVSKSTVYTDVTLRLQEYNPRLALEVAKVLGENLSVRHIRGGAATKKKYKGQ